MLDEVTRLNVGEPMCVDSRIVPLASANSTTQRKVGAPQPGRCHFCCRYAR